MMDLNHVQFDPDDEELMAEALAEVAADATVQHDAPIFAPPPLAPRAAEPAAPEPPPAPPAEPAQ